MADFMIRFLMCNIFISVIAGTVLILKRLFKNVLSGKTQYHLWFPFLGLLTVPFLPFCPFDLSYISLWIVHMQSLSAPHESASVSRIPNTVSARVLSFTDDLTISVNDRVPSLVGSLLSAIWLLGIFVMIFLTVKSLLYLSSLKKSALPLQHPEIRRLYEQCLKETKVTVNIPIFSTAFLKSPVITGVFRPRVYLPVHLISEYQGLSSDPSLSDEDRLLPVRYMLLHELQHYKHRDTLTGYLMSLAGIVYWFNPVIWFILKEMKTDREIACDISVLEMLDEASYKDYGRTLINYAEKLSLIPLSFTAGLSGNARQIERRIICIAAYQTLSPGRKLKSAAVFLLITVLLLGLSPMLSAYGETQEYYYWNTDGKKITDINLSSYFEECDGSFVLYDLQNDSWQVYNADGATLRVSPDSTYKIYDALWGLEEGIITPEHSLITWNDNIYPFEAWNKDQTLRSAMQASVNWYFQEIDRQTGSPAIQKYISEIGYGNKNISGSFPGYWLESSLKISPVEQVELLTKLYDNSFDLSRENIRAVKDALLLSSSGAGRLYGKTGTGRVNEHNVNGWFVGFVENNSSPCIFAANINAEDNADGKKAAEITMSILSHMGYW